MPDFAPTYTARLHWLYACQGRNHLATFRLVRGSLVTDALSMAEAVAAAFAGDFAALLYTDFTTRGWEWAPEDSGIFLPLVVESTVTGSASTTGRPINQVAMQATIPYRTTAGGHGFFSIYGTTYNVYGSPEQDFRVTRAEDASLAALIDALTLIPFVGGDDNPIVIKPYANIGFNARWKRRVRNG